MDWLEVYGKIDLCLKENLMYFKICIFIIIATSFLRIEYMLGTLCSAVRNYLDLQIATIEQAIPPKSKLSVPGKISNVKIPTYYGVQLLSKTWGLVPLSELWQGLHQLFPLADKNMSNKRIPFKLLMMLSAPYWIFYILLCYASRSVYRLAD